MSIDRTLFTHNNVRFHSLAMEYEEKICTFIGILSKFIVEKQFSESMRNGNDIDLETALEISSSILNKVSVLVGPSLTDELTNDLKDITIEYFQEGSEDER